MSYLEELTELEMQLESFRSFVDDGFNDDLSSFGPFAMDGPFNFFGFPLVDEPSEVPTIGDETSSGPPNYFEATTPSPLLRRSSASVSPWASPPSMTDDSDIYALFSGETTIPSKDTSVFFPTTTASASPGVSSPMYRDVAEEEQPMLHLDAISGGCTAPDGMIPSDALWAADAIIRSDAGVPYQLSPSSMIEAAVEGEMTLDDFFALCPALLDISTEDMFDTEEMCPTQDTLDADASASPTEGVPHSVSPAQLTSSEPTPETTPEPPSPSLSTSSSSSKRSFSDLGTPEPESPSLPPTKKPKQTFECHGLSQCGAEHPIKSFTRNFDLLRHLNTKPEPCPRCGVVISRKDAFKRHVKNRKCKPKKH